MGRSVSLGAAPVTEVPLNLAINITFCFLIQRQESSRCQVVISQHRNSIFVLICVIVPCVLRGERERGVAWRCQKCFI